jgi:hypothetical protein
MDLNLVVICGQLAAEPEHRIIDAASSMLRLLVTVRSDIPHRRIDLIPVMKWDPSPHLLDGRLAVGKRVWVTGWLQRSFGDGPHPGDHSSRLEILAHDVDTKELEDDHGPI